jgi:hypothetical protein
MARSRRPAAAGADPRPIVTYSHVPTDVAAEDERVEPRALDPDASIIDAVEVPLVATAEPVHRPRQAPDLRAPDLRADMREDAFDSFEEGPFAAALEPERKRRRGGGLLALVVLIAFAGGAGAIAASLGAFAPPKPAAPAAIADPAAELIAIHKQIDALGEATTPEAQAELARLTKRLAELEQSGAITPGAEPAAAEAAPSGDIGPAVRQISLTPQGDGDIAGAPAAAPPSPRPRPDKPTPAVADVPVQSEFDEGAPVAEPLLPRPLRAAPKAASLPPPPTGKATDDNFIASVEKALADSQVNRADGAMPPVAPMGAVPPVAGAGQPLPPPPAAAIPQQPGDDAPLVLAPAAAAGGAPLPRLDADAADPFAPPVAPPMETAGPQPERLPPGMKLPPADIPNVAPGDQQY